MNFVTSEALEVLIPALATCGGDVGMLFPVARAIRDAKAGNLREIVPQKLSPEAERSLQNLEKEARDGTITPESVIRRYGLPDHFLAMLAEAEANLPSVAGEFPALIRPVIHTLLPVQNGRYRNGNIEIDLSGLVPLGPQTGRLVAHLSGVFASNCSEQQIEHLLAAQAANNQFVTAASKITKVDYGSTKLQQVTLRAKKALNL